MDIVVSPPVRKLIFFLTGEDFLGASETRAHESRLAFSQLAADVRGLSVVLDGSVGVVGGAVPPAVGRRYVAAVRSFVGGGGERDYLRDFADQLDGVAEGRVQMSMHIIEAKWQIIAEVVRLAVELAVIA
ncbi:hypothetical protein ACFRH6_21110, partial [Streptomyces sp. NPDC056749]|uniref:hypothetical protein n=1 Tax=Streptomyces sp. NPDC056749 TaxID=3345936 RepID=UPI0036741713